MTHPEELLAGYVDGSLTDPDRPTVDAHLLTCARCRAEVGGREPPRARSGASPTRGHPTWPAP